jgi:hypothetical protein
LSPHGRDIVLSPLLYRAANPEIFVRVLGKIIFEILDLLAIEKLPDKSVIPVELKSRVPVQLESAELVTAVPDNVKFMEPLVQLTTPA